MKQKRTNQIKDTIKKIVNEEIDLPDYSVYADLGAGKKWYVPLYIYHRDIKKQPKKYRQEKMRTER